MMAQVISDPDEGAILSARGVRKVYQIRSSLFAQLVSRRLEAVTAVDRVSLSLRPHDVLALVGESGCGKSTLGRLLVGLESPTDGTVIFKGRPVEQLRGARAREYQRAVQMVFQNPYESLDPRLTVGATLTEPLEIHGVEGALTRRRRALEALVEVGLTPPEDIFLRLPHELSGGQRQRVAIARAIVLEPEVIIADEPVSMLDASIRSGIMNLMLDLRERRGVSFLFITHDLAVARYMADRIAVMYLGALVEEGPMDSVLSRAGHPYTRFLVAAVPAIRRMPRRPRVRLVGEAAAVRRVPSGCRFHTRCPLAQSICRTETPPVVSVGAGHVAACHFANDVVAMDTLDLRRNLLQPSA